MPYHNPPLYVKVLFSHNRRCIFRDFKKQKQESFPTPPSIDYFLLPISHLTINTINTAHTITSPNITIPALPTILMPTTATTINKINVSNKIANSIIYKFLL